MTSHYRRLMNARTLSSNLQQVKEEILDAGAYNMLEIATNVIKAGTGGNGAIIFQHSATGEDGSWINVTGGSQSITAVGPYYIHVPNFTRYLRWTTDANIASDPIATIDVIAKE